MKDNFINTFCVITLFLGFLNSCNTANSNTNVSEKVESTTEPNIIYIMADDLTTQAISAYGGIYKDIAPTPNIDKIASVSTVVVVPSTSKSPVTVRSPPILELPAT